MYILVTDLIVSVNNYFEGHKSLCISHQYLKKLQKPFECVNVWNYDMKFVHFYFCIVAYFSCI